MCTVFRVEFSHNYWEGCVVKDFGVNIRFV